MYLNIPQESAWPATRVIDNSLADIQETAKDLGICTDVGSKESRAKAGRLCSEYNPEGIRSFVEALTGLGTSADSTASTAELQYREYLDQLVASVVLCLDNIPQPG